MSCDLQATLWLFDQVGREAVPERVHPDALFDARELNRLVHHAVQLPGRHGVERIAAGEITGDVVFMALLRSRCEADRLTSQHTKQSLRTQLPTDPKSKHPYRTSGLVLSPIVSLRERLLSYPKVADRSTSDAEPGSGDPACSGARVSAFPSATGHAGSDARTVYSTLRSSFAAAEKGPHQSPAIVISSMRIEPVRMPPRTSMSDPTSTIFWYMSFRCPAIVTSCTGYWICPFSTQKPPAPRE